MRRIVLYMLAMSLVIAPMSARAEGTADAGFGLIRELRRSEGQFVCSPLSMRLAVSMAVEGAAGDTLAELERVSGGASAGRLDGISALKTANLALVAGDTDLLSEYTRALTDKCDAEIVQMSGDVMGQVNAFVSEHTDGKIAELLTEQPSSDTKLALVNAIAFEDEWLHTFDEAQTKAEVFHAPGGDVSCQMMHLKAGLEYGATDQLQAVKLPYLSGRLSMILVLPREGTLDGVLDALAENGLSALGEFNIEGDVSLGLPKLKLESRISLNDALEALGVVKAFSDEADFSGMTGDRSLYISSVVQAAMIDINESGTSAAAATGIMVSTKSISIAKPLELTFDRPYIALIVDDETDELVFAAAIDDPSML